MLSSNHSFLKGNKNDFAFDGNNNIFADCTMETSKGLSIYNSLMLLHFIQSTLVQKETKQLN